MQGGGLYNEMGGQSAQEELVMAFSRVWPWFDWHYSLFCVQVIPESDAHRAGLQEGDQVLAVNDVDFQDIEHSKVRCLPLAGTLIVLGRALLHWSQVGSQVWRTALKACAAATLLEFCRSVPTQCLMQRQNLEWAWKVLFISIKEGRQNELIWHNETLFGVQQFLCCVLSRLWRF